MRAKDENFSREKYFFDGDIFLQNSCKNTFASENAEIRDESKKAFKIRCGSPLPKPQYIVSEKLKNRNIL